MCGTEIYYVSKNDTPNKSSKQITNTLKSLPISWSHARNFHAAAVAIARAALCLALLGGNEVATGASGCRIPSAEASGRSRAAAAIDNIGALAAGALRQVARAEALALRFLLAAVAGAEAAPLLAVELLADAVGRGDDVALLEALARVEQWVVGGREGGATRCQVAEACGVGFGRELGAGRFAATRGGWVIARVVGKRRRVWFECDFDWDFDGWSEIGQCQVPCQIISI